MQLDAAPHDASPECGRDIKRAVVRENPGYPVSSRRISVAIDSDEGTIGQVN